MHLIEMDKKTIERAKLLVEREKKVLNKLHITEWMRYLQRAKFLVTKEDVYDSWQKTGER